MLIIFILVIIFNATSIVYSTMSDDQLVESRFLIINMVLLVWLFILFIYFQFKYKRPIKQLINALDKVAEANFTRKLKLDKLNTGNELDQLSDKVILLLDKVHYRTSQVMDHREEMEKSLKNLAILNEIGRKIIASLSVETIVKTSYENIYQLVDSTLFAIGIYDPQKNQIDFWGKQKDRALVQIGHDELKDRNRWSAYCFFGQHEIVRNTYQTEETHRFSKLLFDVPDYLRQSFIYLPLISRGQSLGIITVQSFNTNAYNSYDVELLRGVANYISLAIENAIAFQQIIKQKEEITEQTEQLKIAREHLEEQVAIRTHEILIQKEEIEAKNKTLSMLSIVADQTHNAIMVMDGAGNVLWINKSFTRLYEYTYDEFIAARGKNIRQTSFNPDIDKTLNACINEKKTIIYDAPNITLEGKTIWTQTSLTPILDENGKVTYLVTIDTDITERKENELKIIKQSNDITQSIQYASTIQDALLPGIAGINCFFPDSFIVYKPKAIVSGDFYWTQERNGYQFIAVADCTGHGVHGAFMSLLGISFLSDIVNRTDNFDAGAILGKLRKRIKHALKQTDYKSVIKSGMDISLCIFDRNQRIIQFAGAYQSLYLVRKGELLEFKGDRMPIGVHLNDNQLFNQQIIPFLSYDMVYLASDGFKDQFNGDTGHKYLSKQFKQFLVHISDFEIDEQKSMLEHEFERWKGSEYDQTDDVTILGIKL